MMMKVNPVKLPPLIAQMIVAIALIASMALGQLLLTHNNAAL